MKQSLFIEFNGKKIDDKFLFDTVKELWKEKGNKVKDLLNVDLYYKPDEGKCYYVFNEDETGSIEV